MSGSKPKRLWVRFGRIAGRGVLVIVMALLMTEGWFRYRSQRKIADPELPIRTVISRRLLRVWTPTLVNTTIGGLFVREKDNVVSPPFSIFTNYDGADRERLSHIFPYAILPRSGHFQGTDFLLPAEMAAKSTYRASSNALGFRDPERSVEKPPNVFRIVCLGSYTTFGHAVNDDQTFSSHLERLLNERYGPARRFEVWNGGLHAATAVMGLSRVEGDIPRYSPDLVLLDYGVVDISVPRHDSLAPGDDRLRGIPRYGGFRKGPMRVLWSEVVLPYILGGPFGGSYLGTKLIDKMNDAAAEDGSETPVDAFSKVMRRMVGTLRAQGVKVAIMNQVAFPAVRYFELLHRAYDVPFFNVYQMMEPPTEQELRAFDESATWASEFGEYRDRLQSFRQYARFRPYLADIFQLNALGQQRLAEGLLRRLGAEFHDFQ